MARIVLVNGAPGVGKSTVARLVAEATPLALALDIDAVKHSLGRWETDPTAAGHHARRLALAMAEQHVGAGYDVVVGQYLARTGFIEQLEDLAARAQVPVDASGTPDETARRVRRHLGNMT